MTQFNESGLTFIFDDYWDVYKLDDEIDYKKVCGKVPETKCIDFIAFCENESTLLFIEAKGFRGYGHQPSVQNRLTGKSDDITTEIAQKVRDSLAVIIGGARKSTHLADELEKVFRPYWK